MILVAVPVWARSYQSLIPNSTEIPWGRPYSNYSITAVVTDFFENYPATYVNKLNQKLVAKKYESFTGPGGRGTVFFMEFDPDSDMGKLEGFAKDLIWKGSGPSSAHPERIFSKDNVLVIISVANSGMASKLEQVIRSK